MQLTTRTIWIVALRDITAGEELTYNYGYELDDAPAHPCMCGAETCCGFILAPPYQEAVKQQRARDRGCVAAEKVNGVHFAACLECAIASQQQLAR